jgi:hypothetical protein
MGSGVGWHPDRGQMLVLRVVVVAVVQVVTVVVAACLVVQTV